MILAILFPLYGIFLLLPVAFGWKLNPNLAPGILFIGAGAAILYAMRRIVRSPPILSLQVDALEPRLKTDPSSEPLRQTARDLLLGLAYQQTFTHGWSGNVKLPVALEGGFSSTTTMMDRPMSYPDVVARLNDFLKQASVSRRILIGIDEMDKIESDQLANKFLNDLKAVFGVENCFWLVSVSQNAMSAFERRGLPLRDVFDSCFDVIVEVDYLDLASSKRLLRRRAIGMAAPFLCLCHCLSGGLPRDLIRVAREMFELSRVPQSGQKLADLTTAMITRDMNRKWQAVVIAAAEFELEPHTGQFLDKIRTIQRVTTSKELLVACRTLADLVREFPSDPGRARESQLKLAKLHFELAAYYYYCATLMQFFNSDLSEERLKAAEDEPGEMGIDQLARARQAFAVSPQLAWSMNSEFRDAYGMDVLTFEI